MEKEKKRPRGLAAQRAAKKAKVSEEPEANTKDAQTVVLDKIVEEGDEIGEAAALYESAIEKAESDPASALQLIRGTVHECDRILRNWPEGDQRPPAFFYFVYGSALYELGRMTEDEDFGPYLDAAEERLQSGLDRFGEEGHDEKDVEGKHAPDGVRLTAALTKVWLAKAAAEMDEENDDIPSQAQEALKNMDTIYVKGEAEYTPIPFKELVDLASAAQRHGDLYKDLEKQSKFREWAHSILLEITQEEPDNARAFLELGLNRLSLANYWLEQMDEKMQEKDEENEENEEKKTRTPEEEKAFEAISEAKKHFLRALELFKEAGQANAQIYADLAETCLNEANLMLTEEEQNKRYQEALNYIKEAQSAGGDGYNLPEGLQAFLDEWNENKE